MHHHPLVSLRGLFKRLLVLFSYFIRSVLWHTHESLTRARFLILTGATLGVSALLLFDHKLLSRVSIDVLLAENIVLWRGGLLLLCFVFFKSLLRLVAG